MDTNKMMWAVLVPLSHNWNVAQKELMFDDEVWEKVVDECVKSGVNTIVFDLLDGVCYGSHPEIALKGAMSRQRLKKEIKRLKELGITSIPKLNFSATHDGWMGKYGNMLSTPEYYTVCRDLIREVAKLFDTPKYIHLGMDEENKKNAGATSPAIYRHKDLLWHDLEFMCDCVRDMGCTPWIWADPRFDYPEDFKKKVSTEDIVLSPWMYSAIYEEHYTPITSRQVFVDYYNREPYKSMNLTYVEEDPFVVNFMKHAIPCTKDGYDVIPCVSTVNKCIYNATDTLEYFKENAQSERVLGYITSPWWALTKENEAAILKDIKVFGMAKSEVYEGKPCPELKEIDLSDGDISDITVY